MIGTILLNSSIVVAQEVTYLPKGSVTSFDGFLFPENIARETRIKLLEHDLIKLDNEFLKKQSEAKDRIFSLQTQQIELLNTKLDKQRNTNKYESMLWFTLGAVITGFVARGINKN